MQDVVFDTNALLLPFTDGTDILAEVEALVGSMWPVVPSSVEAELRALIAAEEPVGPPSASIRAARGALKLIADWHIERTPLPGDDGVLDVAVRREACIVTNDQTLQAEAAKRGLSVLASRGHGRLHRVGQ